MGGELFVSEAGLIRVLNSAFQVQRRMLTTQSYYALAGGVSVDYAQTVSLTAGQSLTGINFGQRTAAISVSGRLFDDRNNNNQADPGEPNLPGVTVYVDANVNFRFDAGERSAITDASGRYVLGNLPSGDAIVRAVPLAGMDVNSTSTEARLFGTRINNNVANILEIDPIAGTIKNQFNPPAGTTISGSNGLAFDGTDLYFVESTTKRLYAVDPTDGTVRRSLLLTGGGYDGLAAINGKIYAQDQVNNVLLEIDRELTTVLRTLDINQLNPNYLGAGVVMDLSGALGESADGTRLLVQTNNNSISYLVNPTTGIIEGPWSNLAFSGLAGVGGEVLTALISNQNILALNSQAELMRRTSIATDSIFGLAAGLVNSRGVRVKLLTGQDVQLDLSLRDNSPPTAITFSATSISENSPVGSVVANLGSVDANGNDVHIYSLVTGSGSDDNGLFEIVGGGLRTKQVFDFEIRSSYSVRVRSTDATGNSYETSQTISIINLPELSAPARVGNGAVQRSTVDQLVIDMDAPVDIDAGAFLVQRRDYDAQGALIFQTVDTTATLSTLPGGNTRVTITFSGAFVRAQLAAPALSALVDGNYQLTIDSSKVRLAGTSTQLDGDRDGAAGGNYVLGAQAADKFFALFGDTDGDRAVGVADFGRFRAAFGKSKGESGYDAAVDYEGNDAIGVSDFGQFRSRFGKTLSF